jgi:hypothetical protein
MLEGTIDIHMHTAPDIFGRTVDSIDAAQQAHAAGMRGIMLKGHATCTAARAALMQKAVPGLEVYGGLVLNTYVGGLNPISVEATLRQNGRLIWFPTLYSAHHLKRYGSPKYGHMAPSTQEPKDPPVGIRVLDSEGRLVSAAREIVSLVAKEGASIASGHLDKAETVALVKECRAQGVPIVLQHINMLELYDWTRAEIVELADMGAWAELCGVFTKPKRNVQTPADCLDMIGWAGPERTILSSDLGQLHQQRPAEGLAELAQQLVDLGLARTDLDLMLKRNPARFLRLD